MATKNMRFVLAINFVKDYSHQDEFVSMLRDTGLFSTVCQQEKYFSTLSTMLLKDEDPSEYINNNEPFFPGTSITKVLVSDSPVDSDHLVFVYAPDMAKDLFTEKALEIAGGIKKRYFAAMRETAGFKFYKKYLNNNSLKRKELAEAFFYFKEYQQAISQFSGVSNVYPEYCARMVEWCKLLLGQCDSDNRHIFDILVLTKDTEGAYFASKALPEKWRCGVEYWLSTEDILPGQRLLVLYNCFKNAAAVKNTGRALTFLNSIKAEVNRKIGAGTACEKYLWKGIYDQIEAEIDTM